MGAVADPIRRRVYLAVRRAVQAVAPGVMMRETCKRCWRPVASVAPCFDVDDTLWAQVDRAGWNVLCWRCFGLLARRGGVTMLTVKEAA